MASPLTQKQIGILKKSFRQLDAPRVADLFYRKLFAKHPEVRPLFPDDMADLPLKLMSVFELVVFSFDEKKHGQFELQDSVIVPLRELGRKHDDKGVKPEHYEIANGFLLEAMTETAGHVMNNETRQSWQLALEHLTFAMQNKNVRPARSGPSTTHSVREIFANIKRKLRR